MLVKLIITFIFGYFVLRLVRYLQRFLHYYKYISTIPGPKARPLLGNALDFGTSIYDMSVYFIRAAAEERAKGNEVMRLWVGSKPLVVPLTGAAIKPLLDSSEETTKGADYDFFASWLGLGLVTSSGSKWKAHRRMLTPIFHFSMLDGYVEKMDTHAKILVDVLEANVGKETNVAPFIKRCALDIICDTAMGEFLDSQHNHNQPYVLAVAEFFELGVEKNANPLNWFYPYWYVFQHRRHMQLIDTLTSFTKKVMNERICATEAGETVSNDGETKQRKAFLDMLIEMMYKNELSFEDVREEVDTFMFGGHDTTATATSWAIWSLATNKDIQQRAYEEVYSVFGESDRSCTVDDLKSLPYLERCIKETLRFYPSIPMFSRSLQHDLTLQGYTVPSGVDVLINPMCLHHSELVYPNHWEFNPDNFLPENASRRHAYDYIPFSAGPRNCIGQKFAMNEVKVLLLTILRRFSIHSERKMLENRMGPLAVLVPSLGVPVTLKRRI